MNNHVKGGTAILIKKNIKHKVIKIDTDQEWHDNLDDNKKKAHDKSQITGRWIHIEFEYGGTTFNLVNHYYPSSSHYANSRP